MNIIFNKKSSLYIQIFEYLKCQIKIREGVLNIQYEESQF